MLVRITSLYNVTIGKNMDIILVQEFDLQTSLPSVIIGAKISNETAKDMPFPLMNL